MPLISLLLIMPDYVPAALLSVMFKIKDNELNHGAEQIKPVYGCPDSYLSSSRQQANQPTDFMMWVFPGRIPAWVRLHCQLCCCDHDPPVPVIKTRCSHPYHRIHECRCRIADSPYRKTGNGSFACRIRK